ncbi:MAG: hydrogenase maturation protease [Methanospirillum sp.]|nr:hydrogenase maturation protease [Methanospirillum sp.]
MHPVGVGEFADTLKVRLGGAHRVAVIGVGDELSPLDCLGLEVAREIEGLRLPGVMVVFAGLLPESVTGPLRRFRPEVILFLDAAEMGARPGTVAIIEPGDVEATLFSVHVLPLPVVMEFVERDLETRVILIGIQPDAGRGGGLSAEGEARFADYLAALADVLRRAPGVTDTGLPVG